MTTSTLPTRARARTRSRPPAALAVISLFTASCATIESREVKTVLSEREHVIRSLDSIDVKNRPQRDDTLAFSADVSDQCKTITTTREGQEQSVARSWVDFTAAGALGGVGVGFFAWGLKCHNDPYSCQTGDTPTSRTFNGGRTQGYIAIAFGISGALFATHAVYKYARAKDSLSERTYESAEHGCNRRPLPPSGAALVASGQRFHADPGRGDMFVFKHVPAWLVAHPHELSSGPASLEVRGRSFSVTWAEIADLQHIKAMIREREEAIALIEKAKREAREAADRAREAAELARTKPLRDATERLFSAGAAAISRCFHPTQAYKGAHIHSSRVQGEIGVLKGRVDMGGALWGVAGGAWMDLEFSFDPSSGQVRVVPGAGNTMPAKPSCGMRDWMPAGQMNRAARDAVADFQAKATAVAGTTIVVGAYLLSPDDVKKRVQNCASDVVTSHVADAAAEALLNDPNAQAAVASALGQLYKGSVSAADIAKDVAVDAFKRELRRVSPDLANAYSVASFLYCAFR